MYYSSFFNVFIGKAIIRNTNTWILSYGSERYILRFIVTKKIIKRAHVRNLLKRRFLNALHTLRCDFFNIKKDITDESMLLFRVYANRDMISLDFKKIVKEFNKFNALYRAKS